MQIKKYEIEKYIHQTLLHFHNSTHGYRYQNIQIHSFLFIRTRKISVLIFGQISASKCS